jgi:hypothetical protein
MSLLKSGKGRDSGIERSLTLLEERKSLSKSGILSNCTKLTQIEEKIRQFGGLEEMEEDFLKDLNHNSQRLDSIIVSIRSLMRIDPKTKRPSVSPQCKSTNKRAVEKDTSSKRLIDRVEKAIYEQAQHYSK